MFRKYTAVDRAFKNKIITAVEPVFLSLLVDQLAEFLKVSEITMLQHLFSSYRTVDKIDREENDMKMMVPYNPV